jgi:integrase
MKPAYRKYRRDKKNYYLCDNRTGERKTLNTADEQEADRLLHAANEARQTPSLNLQLGKVYLTNSDPSLAKRTWQDAINELSSHGIASTQERYAREFRSKVYDPIREKPLIETTSEDLKAVLKRGTCSTNHALRRLHNLALGNGWIHWHIIPPKQWPKLKTKPKRGTTQDEFDKIIAAEANVERKNYYEMLWETGAAQTDCSLLTAEMFDWGKRVLSYQRQKTKEWCHLGIGRALETLMKKLPQSGLLFPKIAALKDKDRSAEFCRRRRLLGFNGISLHSFRYAWAERAYAAGVPERYAQAALGHSSKAVHHAYAKKAYVICPPIGDIGNNIVNLVDAPASEPSNNKMARGVGS